MIPAGHAPAGHTPWEARGNRIYTVDGREIAVATRAEPSLRAHADQTAQMIVDAVNKLATDRAYMGLDEGFNAALSRATGSQP